MPSEQIHASSVEGHMTEEEAFLQTSRGEAGTRWRLKLGIAGSVILAGAALIMAVSAPMGKDSTRSIVPEAVVSLAASKFRRFTSPYYVQEGICDEEEVMPTKEDCYEAGDMMKPGIQDVQEGGMNPGCRTNSPTGVLWNPNTKTRNAYAKIFLCKKTPKNMPDFVELQGDLDKLTEHCLREAISYSEYKDCVLQIKAWSEDEGWTQEAYDEQQQALDAAATEAQEAWDRAQAQCWKMHADTFSSGFAGGDSSKYGVEGAKQKCFEMGSECAAVTCSSLRGFDGKLHHTCTIRSGTELGKSDSGEFSYTRCKEGEKDDTPADEAERDAADQEAQEEAKCWTAHSSKYSGGYANGVSDKFDFEGAKKKCLELSKCAAITCIADQTQCTVRGSKDLGDSSSGEWSFTYDC